MSTEAGRRLFTKHTDCQAFCEVWGERDAINAIEAEAVAAERARIRAAVEALEGDEFIDDYGEAGAFPDEGRPGTTYFAVDRAAVLGLLETPTTPENT